FGRSAMERVAGSFAYAYLLFLLLTLFLAGEWPAGYGALSGLGCMVLVGANLAGFLLAAGLTYAMALYGLRQSLKRFPWQVDVDLRKSVNQQASVGNGWPFQQLNPKRDEVRLPTVHAVACSYLAGWLFFASATRFIAATGVGDLILWNVRTFLLNALLC